MRRAVARGSGLTRHLLAFSRRRPVNPESVDLVAYLKGMREMLDGSLGGDIHVEMRLAPDLWPVEIDTGEFELAVLNLCVNARDALTGGGTITIATENATDAVDGAKGDFVRLSVADAGSGMTPDVAARVFEPFFTTKDIGKGSGLGLAQVYGFAQQSGGRVFVDSKVGVGTTVTLLLPRSHRLPAATKGGDVHTASPDKDEASRRGDVLLVEDDKEVAALTRELLGNLGFGVIHVESPAAALGALADARSVAAVLCDIMMPGGINGVQLARSIRDRQPNLPIVLTTGYAEAAAGIDGENFGLLLKPYTLEALASALGAEIR